VARAKEFDPGLALDRAMELFWQNGYEATSLALLTERLGIGRASLYATFGDKRELYLKALRHYLESRHPSPIELLSQPGPALPAVRALVELYVQESIEDEQRKGCLVVNSATELLPGDRPVARLVESSWDGIEVALASALTRARAQGELAPGKDPRALARFLLVFLQGVRVMGKGSPNAERLRDAADHALAHVEE
jgi:TetR/AcrR family transcriptional regulator, transcriptional repressor for nem operon